MNMQKTTVALVSDESFKRMFRGGQLTEHEWQYAPTELLHRGQEYSAVCMVDSTENIAVCRLASGGV